MRTNIIKSQRSPTIIDFGRLKRHLKGSKAKAKGFIWAKKYKVQGYKNYLVHSSSLFFFSSFGGRPKTKKAEYNKKAKATDITEYIIQSNSMRLYRFRFNQSKITISSNKSSETNILIYWNFSLLKQCSLFFAKISWII